ncbi:hypothetical protein OIDMADRAFT_43374 [Oidiodendron maius Zn]|uniref:Alpha/beta hydrolase fold-3 domain-containing protein n=1 Tax=Oidiodendron maius (strain Zn) TaxID=913774 RepID=A0A0C3D8U9_OIDMZ|nr:hypothetical protein OIDMADRAFT_43374 [Oidiodendron maius Zn]
MRRRESARSTKISWESGNLEGTLTDSAICHEERTIPGPGGNIALGILRSKNSAGGLRPAIYYTYGGVMVFGTRFYEIGTTFEYIKQLDVVVVSVEYRLAPDHFDPAPVEDCFAGLQWVSEHATELGINSKKAVISGLSAGGGLAAGIALTARDRGGPDLLGQCLIYLMLDDRMSTVSSHQYILYAAPSRATDLSSLPPTWIDVGTAEVFRDENTELHVWPGAWHAFDIYAPDTEIAALCLETRMAWMKRTLEPVSMNERNLL